MAVKSRLIFLILVVLISCSDKQLPFYNSSEFTPEWISKNDPKFNSIHTINNFKLTNQDGETVSSSDLKNNIYVADFFFTSCTSICPIMTNNMKKIYEKFSNEDKVKILSFTVDPETDDVKKLKEYSDKLGVNNDRWNFLTGSKKDIYTVARKSFFADDDTGLPVGESDFIHTEKFILVDNKNRIRGVYNGTTDEEISRLEEDINILKKELD
jgi:protein SCO1